MPGTGASAPGRRRPGSILPAKAPVVEQGPFTQGIDFYHVADTLVPGELAGLLSLGDDLPQQAVVGSPVVQQVARSRGHQLGGK